jgi:methylmalonyl-CoA mutase
MAELLLARGFSPADEATWKTLALDALKGEPFTSMTSTSYDGIVIDPLYRRVPGASVIPGRTLGERWEVMQRIDLPDAASANKQILEDLNNGATGLALVFEGAVGDYGYALPASKQSVARLLDGVHLDAGVDLDIDFGPPSRRAAGLVAAFLKAKGTAPSAVRLRFSFDPLGALATHGGLPKPWSAIAPEVVGMVADLHTQGFAGPFFPADARPIHAAGGSEAQELAFALATAVAYLRAMVAGGITLADARRFIYFRLAADQDQFLTIAKFRAMRKLWARVEQACGLRPEPCFIAAETAWRMMTKRDPHGNIVRTTIAALAAAVGGADAITVLPFSVALGVPDAFARRIARNTQTILIEESNLHRVADPAAGAGAIEALTDALCGAAWWFFQKIEQKGGAAEALKSGYIQRAVARVRAEREGNAAMRKASIVGSSDFPDLAEEAVVVLGSPEMRTGDAADLKIEPLRRLRLAEPFEQLRDRSDAYLAKHGERPKVFLACLGGPSDFNARASFAKSLFGAGGIDSVPGSGDNLVKGFKQSEARLACLCSSDKVYSSQAAAAAKSLAEAGAKRIYLAGKPAAGLNELTSVGAFIHQGCDTLAILTSVYDEIDRDDSHPRR